MKRRLEQFINRETQLEMTPMIDIVFNVLIFFITVSSFTAHASLVLPEARHGQPPRYAGFGPNAVVVEADAEAPLYFAGYETTIEQLTADLQAAVKRADKAEDIVVVVVADTNTEFSRVRKVLVACLEAGITHTRIATRDNLSRYKDDDGTADP